MSSIAPRARGALLIALATLCWSSGGIIVRSVAADGWTIVFWRSVIMASAIAAYLVVSHRSRAVTAVRALGWTGVVSGLLLGGSFFGYILALQHTSVANTLVLMSGSPLVAAVLARFLNDEPLTGRTLSAIALALAGIAVMVAGGLGQGAMIGNLCALMVAILFGANIAVLRSRPDVDMVPTTMIAGLFSALAALPLAAPLAVSAHDLGLLAVMGVVQLALGLFLFVTGARYLSSAETGLLTLLEMVLGPLWVWVGIGEAPTTATLTGGLVVLAALVLQSTAGRPDRTEPTPEPLRERPAET